MTVTRRWVVSWLVVFASLAPLGATRAATTEQLLYVSMAGEKAVLVFDAGKHDPQPLREITDGLIRPGALAVDGGGNLYVCDAVLAQVVEFAPGAASPTFEYNVGDQVPVTVAIAPNGNIFVLNQFHGYRATIFEFRPGLASPIARWYGTRPAPAAPAGLAFDAKSNLFVLYSGFTSDIWVVEYPATLQSTKTFHLEGRGAQAIAVDRQGRLVIDESDQLAIFQLGRRKAIRVLREVGFPAALAFEQGWQHVYLADPENNLVSMFAYPSGKLVNFFTHGMADPHGIAIGPPPL